jgi:ABC-type glutathione transport system ATPase component
MSADPMLEVSNLSVSYAGRRQAGTLAVDSVNLVIDEGQTHGLVGESGSGKSTLGKAILGLVRISGGSVLFGGSEITHADKRRRRELSQQVQVVFQDPYTSFNPSRTVGQTVSETLTVRTDLDRADIRRRVADMLERVGIGQDAAGRYPAQFSGGQRQRIAIARALLPRPRLVICDEPVSALDLSVQAQVLNLLIDLQNDFGLAYLFISHDLAVVQHLCHYITVLRRGRVVESGEAAQVCSAPSDAYTRELLAAAPVADPAVQQQRREQRLIGRQAPPVAVPAQKVLPDMTH